MSEDAALNKLKKAKNEMRRAIKDYRSALKAYDSEVDKIVDKIDYNGTWDFDRYYPNLTYYKGSMLWDIEQSTEKIDIAWGEMRRAAEEYSDAHGLYSMDDIAKLRI